MIIYIDHSEVREGKLAELRPAVQELATFIEANVPRLLAYHIYLSDDERRMSVVHVHSDLASLEFHLKAGGPAFRRFVDLVKLTSIDVYGTPGPELLERLREKARMLGDGTVNVHALQAGFSRIDGA